MTGIFALAALRALRKPCACGAWLPANTNIALSITLCMIAVWRGFVFANPINTIGWIQVMRIPRDAVLLRIFFGEDDKFGHLPLHEAIVVKARQMHLGGATVLRGHVGFGHSTRIHTMKVLRLAQDLPLVVEIIDAQEKIDQFLPVLDTIMTGGLVTMEKVQVLQYGTDGVLNEHR